MLTEQYTGSKRGLKTVSLEGGLVVVGGGISGVCAAVTAARAGIEVVLIQDRPVLGGNASSEVRLWILGATSHMGNNNRWSREGGVMDEILVENAYRNPGGNPVILDTVMLDIVRREKNIKLLLNTAVYDIEKSSPGRISMVRGFCSQNSTFYDVSGTLFCDASGDGIIGYMAGAAFRMGAEEKETYGEMFAPDTDRYGALLGNSIYFYSKDTGKPVKFVAPDFALQDITEIPRWGRITPAEHGCKFWWLEYGGRLDTIHDAEDIKWELWRVVYGVWNHIKNSGQFPEAENMTLEWVGIIPGKRESRRFVGEYTLIQQDIIEQRFHEDAVAFGGWAIDLHPADGVYSTHNGCIQYHSKGVYTIPYRCFVSRDIDNLFFAGRTISASHVAHGSSRVMATSGFGAQAVGMAAAMCIRKGVMPGDIAKPEYIGELQNLLNRAGQSIPGTAICCEGNLAAGASVSASSELGLACLPFDGPWNKLDFSAAQLLPLEPGTRYGFTVEVKAGADTVLTAQLRHSEKPANYTPDVIAETLEIPVAKGTHRVKLEFSATLPERQYGFVTFMRNEDVSIRMSGMRCTGVVSVFNKFNHAVNNNGKQTPEPGLGIDSFEFWCPDRRPAGHNIAMEISPAVEAFGAGNAVNGVVRPRLSPNAWVASPGDGQPRLKFEWDKPRAVSRVTLFFDTDFDHALESVQMEHAERTMPFCVRSYELADGNGNVLYKCTDNHQTINSIVFDAPVETDTLVFKAEHPSGNVPASLFQMLVE